MSAQDLYTASGLARALGVSRQRLHQLTEEPTFPAPAGINGGEGPRVWLLSEVLAWRERSNA